MILEGGSAVVMMMMMVPLPQLGVIANDEASEEDRRYRNSLPRRQRRTERDTMRSKTNVAKGSHDELGLAAIVTLAPACKDTTKKFAKNGRPHSNDMADEKIGQLQAHTLKILAYAHGPFTITRSNSENT
jgi:hypothetical protein